MYVLDNPVLQRELLVNLRMTRAFVLLLLYQALLGAVVYFAWPQDTRVDLTAGSQSIAQTRHLVNLFFAGQYVLASMMAPSFAAGSITGEKERKTYEMLLASPLRPAAIVLGKLVAALTHLGVLIFASLPIVMLCLPLGGVSVYEVLAAYLGLLLSVVTFGMISVAASAYFQRTSAALVVSYLLILPLALLGVIVWMQLADQGFFRLMLILTVLPAAATAVCLALFFNTSALLLHPPDVGSEGKEVVDLEQEAQQAVGLVIQRDQFPDRLFAPPKRDDLMEDDANPVYDKEIRSEIFSQGTLMLRIVIQMSMLLAIPLMFFCFYWTRPEYAAWYVSYVVLFNVLVGPVFSAGTVTSERERETLELLLTTILSPWQILWAKLVAGLRVSSVLTMFLVWPLLLACLMVSKYWSNWFSMILYMLIIVVTCLTTATLALFFSVIFRKTAVSLMTTYLTILILFMAPPAAGFFEQTFFNKDRERQQAAQRDAPGAVRLDGTRPVADNRALDSWVTRFGFLSPFSAAFSVPLEIDNVRHGGTWPAHFFFLGFYVLVDLALVGVMTWLFNVRWRVAQ